MRNKETMNQKAGGPIFEFYEKVEKRRKRIRPFNFPGSGCVANPDNNRTCHSVDSGGMRHVSYTADYLKLYSTLDMTCCVIKYIVDGGAGQMMLFVAFSVCCRERSSYLENTR